MAVSERAGAPFRLWVWLLVGVLFDGVALTGFGALAVVVGPLLRGFAEVWLLLVVLIGATWSVYVVLLPCFFRLMAKGWNITAMFLIWGLVFTLNAALLIPFVGVATFWIVLFILAAFVGGPGRGFSFAPPTLADRITTDLLWIATASIAGAAVGGLLSLYRQNQLSCRAIPLSDQPKARSDLLGGMSAAFIAFAGTIAAAQLGWFFPAVSTIAERPLGVPTT